MILRSVCLHLYPVASRLLSKIHCDVCMCLCVCVCEGRGGLVFRKDYMKVDCLFCTRNWFKLVVFCFFSERTDKIPMNSIKTVVSEPIDDHEEYHIMVGVCEYSALGSALPLGLGGVWGQTPPRRTPPYRHP